MIEQFKAFWAASVKNKIIVGIGVVSVIILVARVFGS